jgi:tetratricopeptide (TPR) repeat protein
MLPILMRQEPRFVLPAARVSRAVVWITIAVLATGCGPSDPIQDVRELQRRGRFHESLEPLRELLTSQTENSEVYYLYGLALMRTGQPGLAHWSFRKAMEDPEWLVPTALQLASGALEAANHEAAIEAAERALAVEPNNTDALLLRAQARLESRRDYEGALADAERALELDPANPAGLLPRAGALLGLERIDEAGDAIDELERRFREDALSEIQTARFCAVRAVFASEKGEKLAAAERFEQCLEQFPSSNLVISAAIRFHDAERQPERSLQILRDVLEEFPGATAYRSALADRLEARGDSDEAERILREGTEVTDPESRMVGWVLLSRHYDSTGDHAQTLVALEQAIEVKTPPETGLLSEYANALVVAGRYDEALEVGGKIEVPAMRELIEGAVLLAQGQPAAALEHFAAGLQHWPDNADARYKAALAAERSGDVDRAIEEYRYSIRIQPTATDARLRLTRLHLAEGELGLAQAAAVQGSGRFPRDLEAELAALRGCTSAGAIAAARDWLGRLVDQPQVAGRAVAAFAEGIRRRVGPGEAAAAIRRIATRRRLDLADPLYAEVLASLVANLHAAGDDAAALDRVKAALNARPDEAAFHAIYGRLLETNGAAVEEVRAAFDRALELDSGQATALAGLARLAESRGDLDTAVELYARASGTDADGLDHRRAGVSMLLSADRRADAVEQLELLLAEHPYDATAAIQLAGLLLDADARANASHARDLGQRAVRFRGGDAAAAVLTRAELKLAEQAPSS